MAENRGRPGRRPSGFLIMLLVALATALSVSLVAVPSVSASSEPNTITFDPQTGQVGTPVTVYINADVPGPTDYTLMATMTAPATDGCTSGQPIPGLAPINVGTQGGGATFNWPAQLSAGPYYLCAKPTSTSGPVAQSQTLFTVVDSNGRVPTPVPTPTSIPISGTVTVTPLAGGVKAGATITVQVTHWANAQKRPADVIFYSQDPTKAQNAGAVHYAAQFTLSGEGSSYTLQVTVPENVPSGTYWLAVGDGVGEIYSKPFAITAAPAPTATAASPSAGAVQTDRGPSALLMIALAAVMVLLVLLGGMLARTLTHRHSTSSPPPWGPGRRAAPYGPTDDSRAHDYSYGASRSAPYRDDGRREYDSVRSSSRDGGQPTYPPRDGWSDDWRDSSWDAPQDAPQDAPRRPPR